MYLKQIKMSGFKSFAKKTIIELDKGIAGVVGPNGSGKSNIVDAVRWVLGEQSIKSLRGEGSMIDVVFSGSKSKKPCSMASVTLVFNNEDKFLPLLYTEVEVKRVIYKTGESEYYLNNEKCRLKDIADLFSDTGVSKESFNIISQGDIGAILSDKPEDRRIVFESAAGVLKYKRRKEEAIRKLDRTKENIDRINDIINEIELNIEPLRLQSIDAKEYLKYKEKLDNLEVSLIVNDIEKINYDFQLDKKRASQLSDEIISIESNTIVDNNKLEEYKLKQNKINDEIYESQQKLLELTTKAEKLNNEKVLIIERQKYESTDQKVHDNIINLKEKLLAINSDINVLEKKKYVCEEELNSYVSQIVLSEEKLSKLKTEHDKLIEELTIINKLENDINHKIDMINNSIENNFYLPKSVKYVLDNPKLPGIHNVISNVIEVEKAYSIAISTALGFSSNNIIVDDEECAKEAIRYLKTNSFGRATFFPISIIIEKYIDDSTYKIICNKQGFVGIASSLVKYESVYDRIIKNQLGNTIIVDNIDNAIEISRQINNKYKIVTMDGQVIHVGGSLTGGNIQNNSSLILEKHELEELKLKYNSILQDKEKQEHKINEIDSKYNIENNNMLQLINKKTEVLSKIRYEDSKLLEFISQKNNIISEIDSMDNSIDISKKEEEILNQYYEVENNRQKKQLELDNLYKNSTSIKEEIDSLEGLYRKSNSEYSKKQEELKVLEIKINRADVKLDNLLDILTNEYNITYEKAKSNYILEDDEKETRKIVSDAREKIKKLGVVNIGAIEEYDRIKTRYDFLSKQKEDLLGAKITIENIIKELDELMKVKFEKTFNEIKEKFVEVYKKLFGGGDARLSMTDENNILYTGIQIKALPPGKTLQHLSLLSGGEKALTAIALLFAILETRPVPFCILDEVEAALDDINVNSFGKYLESLKEKTQFLVITHKKRTMEFSDILYGITMQETGVSKLVSVKLEKNKKDN